MWTTRAVLFLRATWRQSLGDAAQPRAPQWPAPADTPGTQTQEVGRAHFGRWQPAGGLAALLALAIVVEPGCAAPTRQLSAQHTASQAHLPAGHAPAQATEQAEAQTQSSPSQHTLDPAGAVAHDPAGNGVSTMAADTSTVEVAGVTIAPTVRPAWQPPDAPRQPFIPRVERWRPLVRELLAEAWDQGRLDGPASALDDDLILALIQQESTGDPTAHSWAGAAGLMQLMPFTFAEMMHGDQRMAAVIDPAAIWDVRSNVRAGIRYLALAMKTHDGNLYWAVAAYNAGIRAVGRWRAAGLYAVPPIGGYTETAAYAPTILRNYLRHRPGLQMEIPDSMPQEHVAGAMELIRIRESRDAREARPRSS